MHRLAWYGWAAALAIAATGCLQRKPAPPPRGPTLEEQRAAEAARAARLKAELDAQFARELPELTVFEVATADGSVRSRIEAAAQPQVVAEPDHVSIAAPFAHGQAIQCFVYPAAKDGADTLRQLVATTLAVNAPEHRWVDVHGDHANGWPYLIGRAHYFVSGPNGKSAGDFKIGVSVRGETTVACGLDVPGYYASFERALRGLLSALDTASNRALPRPQAAAITRTQLAGRMVSLEATTEYKDGRTTIVEQNSMDLSIGDDGSLATSDDTSRKTFRRGKLESGAFAGIASGERLYAIELAFKRRAYFVKGTSRDSGIDGEFTVEGGIPDSQRTNALACAVRDGKPARAEIQDYLPSANPVAPSMVIMEQAQTPDADLVVTVASAAHNARMQLKLDAACEPERGTIQLGTATIEFERIWQSSGDR